MIKVLNDLLYTKTHEWVRIEDNVAIVGISDYAQKSLGTATYVEAFEGEFVNQFSECGAVESTKAASDIMAPVSGNVIEVNQEVIDNPELINLDPYSNWILKIEISNNSELSNLLNSSEYKDILE